MGFLGVIVGAVLVVAITALWRELVAFAWWPYVVTKKYRKQGVQGPPYRFFSGSIEEIRSMKSAAKEVDMDIHSHDITVRIVPHYRKWISQYGEPFLYWWGPKPRLVITDPELIRQVLSNKFGVYPKQDPHPTLMALLGKGLILTEGPDWARHRSVVSPAFAMDKLKLMTSKVAECTQSMLEGWRCQTIQAGGQQYEIEVGEQFEELTADVISHTAFGSSYMQGKEVFHAQDELQRIAAATILNVNIPGYKYLPTRTNLERWKLERKVRTSLMQIIEGRLKSKESGYGKDLLGLMMEACMPEKGQKQADQRLSMDEIIDECKTFFFAGQETTSHLLTWTMFLLSTNQDWQERLREEVLKECGMEIPNADMLSKLKLMSMVLFEALRLYSPAGFLIRKAVKDTNLGGLEVPKGTLVTMPLLILHRKKDLWGADADEFNPLRFENGISKAAKHPHALLAFSSGPRSCIGQNFAMLESKTVLAMILQRFSFSISPKYRHAPLDILTLQPQHGLPLAFKPLSA